MHMNNKKLSLETRTNTNKKICSTPERRIDSPTIDNDSICDSQTASPIHFMCTQDDADVIYNFYTPKSESKKSKFKGTTPVSRKTKNSAKLQKEKQLPKRKIVKPSHQRNKLLEELRELNQNVHELVKKSSKDSVEKTASEEDIFSDTSDSSPRGGMGFKKRCLRKNVLSSKFVKPEPECGLESDDSINECLIRVSQAVEEKLNDEPELIRRPRFDTLNRKSFKTSMNYDFDQDSMDDLLSNVKLHSPHVKKLKKCHSPQFHNDSFDSLLENLNDSTLDRLTQMPVKKITKTKDTTKLEEVNDEHQFPNSFIRHNSMPVSPSVANNKPSTSGMSFGRFNSMPFNKSSEDIQDGSPIKYTPEEIKKKRQQAREKLLARRMLPTASQQQSLPILPTQGNNTVKINNFQVKVDSRQNNVTDKNSNLPNKESGSDTDMKLLIEKKRQEALMKLRKRQAQCR